MITLANQVKRFEKPMQVNLPWCVAGAFSGSSLRTTCEGRQVTHRGASFDRADRPGAYRPADAQQGAQGRMRER